jgi:hypothetical protein
MVMFVHNERRGGLFLPSWMNAAIRAMANLPEQENDVERRKKKLFVS